MAPAGTPRTISEKLHREFSKAIQDEGVKTRPESFGSEIVGSSPAEFSEVIRTDSEKFKKLSDAIGLKID